ncbi:MAG TPA: vanadium-dependent haloperoxidase [Vicinamibacterales bacterium]|nr:vanadium-dependent haloperoxidase [Vicinamibacterales bacterium]
MAYRVAPVLTLAACLAVASPAHADVVTEWNEIADGMTALAPPFKNRIMAMVQVAVHDVLTSIDPRYETYLGLPSASSGASAGAAVAAAAYRVLLGTVPSQAAALGVIYNGKIAGLSCPASHPTCITEGIVAGETAAFAMLSLRASDGSATPHLPYTLLPAPGVHQPTPPNLPAPQFAGWAQVTPFVINSSSQFRADPSEIFDLLGEVFTRDYNEVKRVGSVNSEVNGDRTPDQSAIARYWAGGGANFNLASRIIVAGRGLDEWEHARLFALVNLALHDDTITIFDTKYTYNFWRPATAIRAGASDGNPNTDPDPGWLSYQATPPYPDYTCGLPNNTGAALEVMRRFFGTDDIAYTMTAAGLTRSFTSLSHAGAEAVDARVFGGMHFRTGCVQGLRQGEKVGRFVILHALKPLKGKAKKDQ